MPGSTRRSSSSTTRRALTGASPTMPFRSSRGSPIRWMWRCCRCCRCSTRCALPTTCARCCRATCTCTGCGRLPQRPLRRRRRPAAADERSDSANGDSVGDTSDIVCKSRNVFGWVCECLCVDKACCWGSEPNSLFPSSPSNPPAG